MFVENSNIGVIDIETFKNKDGCLRVYALGFKTNLDDKPIIYYINPNKLHYHFIVFSLVEQLYRSEYENVTFYCDNFGGYDMVYILHSLEHFNDTFNYVCNETESTKGDKYIKFDASCIVINSRILRAKIS